MSYPSQATEMPLKLDLRKHLPSPRELRGVSTKDVWVVARIHSIVLQGSWIMNNTWYNFKAGPSWWKENLFSSFCKPTESWSCGRGAQGTSWAPGATDKKMQAEPKERVKGNRQCVPTLGIAAGIGIERDPRGDDDGEDSRGSSGLWKGGEESGPSTVDWEWSEVGPAYWGGRVDKPGSIRLGM